MSSLRGITFLSIWGDPNELTPNDFNCGRIMGGDVDGGGDTGDGGVDLGCTIEGSDGEGGEALEVIVGDFNIVGDSDGVEMDDRSLTAGKFEIELPNCRFVDPILLL